MYLFLITCGSGFPFHAALFARVLGMASANKGASRVSTDSYYHTFTTCIIAKYAVHDTGYMVPAPSASLVNPKLYMFSSLLMSYDQLALLVVMLGSLRSMVNSWQFTKAYKTCLLEQNPSTMHFHFEQFTKTYTGCRYVLYLLAALNSFHIHEAIRYIIGPPRSTPSLKVSLHWLLNPQFLIPNRCFAKIDLPLLL